MSVPMQNVKATLMPDNVSVINYHEWQRGVRIIPQPKMPLDVAARTIAHGMAVAALVASSLMCTVESNAPWVRGLID